MASPTGTLLIDARSAGARLPRELALVAPLAADHTFELTVIDDTHDPRIARIARRYTAHHVPLSRASLGERLTTGIQHASGSVLVFPRLGCINSTRTLLRLARRVSSGEVDAMILSGTAPSLLARLFRHKKPVPIAGICLARQWYERLGGCDPLLDRDVLDDLVERLRLCGARLEHITLGRQPG